MIPLSAAARRMTSSAIREILTVTQQPDVISFAGGLPAPELFPVEEIRAATDRILVESGREVLQYSSTEGHLPLREWIAARGGTTADRVQITSGSQQGLDLLGRVLIDPGDVVLVERPTYLGALQAFSPYGARFVEVATDAEGIVPEALAELLDRTPAKLLYTIPSFQNPTGRTLTLDRRRALLEVTRRHGVTVIEDGPYNELRFRGPELPTLFELAREQAENLDDSHVVHLGTFSKILAPGLRDAWVQGPQHVIERLVLAKQAADLHSPSLNQMIVHALVETVLPQQIARVRGTYGHRAAVMSDALARHFPSGTGVSDPEGGMFTWVDLPPGDGGALDTGALLATAVEAKVAYVPGQPFFAHGDGSRTLRLNFTNSTDEQIETGIRALGEVFAAAGAAAASR
ncbi:PLP-dependent aminotransferase family protein [Brachybacterium sp. FME24]|uniref:aminotransferase-like domain-containing protein n=1 Tax=Brachybacterium sp. FME24 TaxID=2742605 RepID=UPI00186691B4|nr:PLP-dependent aminotransferase family protein [Brachybacterium sp. FME24]